MNQRILLGYLLLQRAMQTTDDPPITIDDLEDLMGELRSIAHNLLQCESDADSIRATALVISGLRRYKLTDQDWSEITWANRSHFFKSAYMMMRRSLIDHARRRRAAKRPRLVPTEDEALDLFNLARAAEQTPEDVIALDEALAWMAERNYELSLLVQHYYISALTHEEIAKVAGVSVSTIKRDLGAARGILKKKIEELREQD